MAATQCGNGHIYDSDIYPACPYCNGAQPMISFGGAQAGSVGPTMGPKSGFGGTPVGSAGPTMGPRDGFGGTPVGSAGPTMGPRDAGFAGGGINPTVGYGDGQSGRTVMDSGKTAPIGGPLGGEGVPVTDYSVTRPPRGYEVRARRVDEDIKTTGRIQKKLGIDPVVGWLVCVDGPDKGKDYRLLGRVNTIGRSEKMDVCIKGDQTISSVNHARIGYGDKNNRFTLIPAEGTNVIYLNGEEVYIPAVLAPYDVIEIGETTLVFIPFCSERFTWQKGMTDGRNDSDGTV